MTRVLRCDVQSQKGEQDMAFGLKANGDPPKKVHFSYLLSGDAQPRDPFDQACEAFRIDIKQFLTVARAKRPCNPVATVTGFSGWVHSLYAPQGNEFLLKIGRSAEGSIYQARRKIFNDDRVWAPCASKWSLVHNGLRIGSKDTQEGFFFKIPSLAIGGQPLRANPDLVYENAEDAGLIIVEIKFSMSPIPQNLWPDIWAQLWAYSKIPEFNLAKNVEVVGEVWADNIHLQSRFLSDAEFDSLGLFDDIYLRRVVKRDPKKAAFDGFFGALFDIYRGVA